MPLTIPPYHLQPPAVKAWIDWMLGPTIAPTLAVSDKLDALLKKGVPNNPRTSAQGSARLHFGALPWLYQYRYTGLTAGQVQLIERFLVEEERWRGLGTGAPKAVPVAHEVVMTETGWETGPPILRADGQPVQVEVADAQHFTLASHLAIAMISNDPLARQQVLDLLAWADHWSATSGTAERNPRAWGWVLLAAAQVEAARIALSLPEPRPREILTRGLSVLAVARREAVVEFEKWMPMDEASDAAGIMLHPAGRKQKDHGHCRRCTWMHGVLGHACDTWATLPTGGNSVAIAGDLATVALRHTLALAAADGAPLGGLWDDHDPEPGYTRPPAAPTATVLHDPLRHRVAGWFGATSRTCVVALLHRAHDRAAARAIYDFVPGYRFSTHTVPDWHHASSAIRAAGVLGYWR